MSPELRLFLEAMQQDFHTTMLIAFWSVIATFTVCVAMWVWGWRTTAAMRKETATLIANIEARTQAIMAQTQELLRRSQP